VVVSLGLVTACRGGDGSELRSASSLVVEAAAPTTTAGTPTSTGSTPTRSSTSTSTSTTTTSTTVTPTSTTTTTSSVPAYSGEDAVRLPGVRLRRPDGFARHEPLPAWQGDAPLTGLPIDAATRSRPALAVKVDNSPQARPQWSLNQADIVIEENVEGITRFVAVFHSRAPDRVGPVRSARTTDPDLLAALNRPILAFSGGNPYVTSYVRGAHALGWLSNLSAQLADCYWRSGLRSSPHDLMLDPLCAWESTTYAGPARPLFEHGHTETPVGGEPELEYSVRMYGLDVEWAWDAELGRYLRRQAGDWHVDAFGEVIAAVNVVELDVVYRTSAADPLSPEADTVGSGRAVVHRDGISIDGWWSRDDRFEPFALTTDDGLPIALAAGNVFVELT
jgi:hypothetical protein